MRRSRLGASSEDITYDLASSLGLASTEGAIISTVEHGSPAEKAGVKPRDVVTGVDGRVVHNARRFTQQSRNEADWRSSRPQVDDGNPLNDSSWKKRKEWSGFGVTRPTRENSENVKGRGYSSDGIVLLMRRGEPLAKSASGFSCRRKTEKVASRGNAAPFRCV